MLKVHFRGVSLLHRCFDNFAWQVLTFVGAIGALAVMTFIAVSIGQVFHAVPDAAGGLPLDDYASILAPFGWLDLRTGSLKRPSEGFWVHVGLQHCKGVEWQGSSRSRPL